jgi:glycosyltransferase involved in cell wall biosynthesis
MKIMYCTYPMAFHTPGGGEVQLMAYYKYMCDKATKIRLFDPWNPRLADQDLVHYFSCVGGSVHFCRFIKSLEIPLIISSSLWITPETQELYPAEEIRIQLEMSDTIVTNSDMESEAISETLGIPLERFYTVYNGVDPLFLERPSAHIFREKYGMRDPYILCVGNIEPRKNQLTLAKAMHQFPEYKLVLMGHVRNSSYLDKVIESGLEGQVIYINALPNDSIELRSAYQGCQAFCLPSTLETPGLAALEAAAQGCAIALTSVGSTREYFGNAVAYLQPDEPESIVEALARALQQNSDQKNNLAKIGESFTWPQVVKRLQSLYEQF